MKFKRASGILLHPTSFPGRFGVGDLGDEAFRFVDFLARSGQHLWQVLPLGPTGYGDSPYQCFSAFAGNPLLISPQALVTEKFLEKRDIAHLPAIPAERVDYSRAIDLKKRVLDRAFERFRHTTDTGLRADFETFCQQNSSWLEDYALFRALKSANGGKAWYDWDARLAGREAGALRQARDDLRLEIEAEKFFQYLFFKQWGALKEYANKASISIIGDIPIFVALDSADVWTQPDQFKLDQEMRPLVVAGVPPDYFSPTGQLWGNPIYAWDRMRADRFRWWIERISATLRIFDIVRIDHFRGFAAAWEVPGGDKTAERGQWVKTPGRELFAAIRSELGDVPIIAEDLGVITPDVDALRDDFKLPGMRILEFGFGGDSSSRDLPHNYPRNSVVYTGTHDNDTVAGWFRSTPGEGSTRDAAAIERERNYCLEYLNSDGSEIQWDFIRAVMASVADTAIVPLQDVLGLGTEARMNLPGTTSGNWSWRYQAHALADELASRLADLARIYGRN